MLPIPNSPTNYNLYLMFNLDSRNLTVCYLERKLQLWAVQCTFWILQWLTNKLQAFTSKSDWNWFACKLSVSRTYIYSMNTITSEKLYRNKLLTNNISVPRTKFPRQKHLIKKIKPIITTTLVWVPFGRSLKCTRKIRTANIS